MTLAPVANTPTPAGAAAEAEVALRALQVSPHVRSLASIGRGSSGWTKLGSPSRGRLPLPRAIVTECGCRAAN